VAHLPVTLGREMRRFSDSANFLDRPVERPIRMEAVVQHGFDDRQVSPTTRRSARVKPTNSGV